MDPVLSRLLILKGGCAMRLFDGLDSRLSIDADFSVEGAIDPDSEVFSIMEENLASMFHVDGYGVIDFRAQKRPKKSRPGFPAKWGGWACEFKLVPLEFALRSLEVQRKRALIPMGANSPKITIDLSEFEYCGKRRVRTINGIKIRAYSPEMLVLEKIRAICQQHPDYSFRQEGRNRARDLFDIYELTESTDDDFKRRCRNHLKKVFLAKEVPLDILQSLWSDPFIDELRRGFEQVRGTVRKRLFEFDFYVEHLRFFLIEIYPEVLE